MNISAKATFEMDNGNFSLSTVAFLLPSGPESHVINFTCLPLTHTRSFVKSHRFLRFIITQQLTISYTSPRTATTFDFSYLYSFQWNKFMYHTVANIIASTWKAVLRKRHVFPAQSTKTERFSLSVVEFSNLWQACRTLFGELDVFFVRTAFSVTTISTSPRFLNILCVARLYQLANFVCSWDANSLKLFFCCYPLWTCIQYQESESCTQLA